MLTSWKIFIQKIKHSFIFFYNFIFILQTILYLFYKLSCAKKNYGIIFFNYVCEFLRVFKCKSKIINCQTPNIWHQSKFFISSLCKISKSTISVNAGFVQILEFSEQEILLYQQFLIQKCSWNMSKFGAIELDLYIFLRNTDISLEKQQYPFESCKHYLFYSFHKIYEMQKKIHCDN